MTKKDTLLEQGTLSLSPHNTTTKKAVNPDREA